MLKLGYIGRRSIYETVRRVTFNISLFERGDITIVDGGLREKGDVVLNCGDYICVAKELFTTIPKILGGGKLGVDLGTSKNGLVYVWRGEPILHAVVDIKTVEEILREATSLDIHIGSSPYVDVKKATAAVGCKEVYLVDELTASFSRPWIQRRYPDLQEDEVDALSFTFHNGVAATIC